MFGVCVLVYDVCVFVSQCVIAYVYLEFMCPGACVCVYLSGSGCISVFRYVST